MTLVSKIYSLLKELRCATALEIATRLGMSRKVVQTYLNRLAARDAVEKRTLGRRAVMYCVKEDGESIGHKPRDSPATEGRRVRRDAGLHAKTQERLAQTLELLKRNGCVSVGALMRMLRISHSKAYHVMRVLLLLRQGVKVRIGNTAVLCRDRAAAEETVARLRDAVHRLVTENGMRYATAPKVLQAAVKDRETFELLSRFVPLRRNAERFPPALLKFVDDVLRTLYGEPLRYRRRTVYIVSQPRQDYTISVTDSVETHTIQVKLPDDLAALMYNVDNINEVALQALEQLLARYRT
jgi:predicted transcriptional regulator